MSFGWGSGTALPGAIGVSGGMAGGGGVGGWGFTGMQPQRPMAPRNPQQPNYEAMFNSLFPINGMVTGDQVKPIFESSGLSSQSLAQIWNSVDSDHDGRINLPQFCTAMSLISQAKQAAGGGGGGGMQRGSGLQGNSLHSSLSSSALSSGFASWGSASPSTPPSKPLSSSWSSSMLEQKGVGRGVSLAAISEGWAMKYQDKQKYIMQFNTHDRNHTGYLSGAEVRPLLTKSDLDKGILAKIWELADVDKDGRLTAEEFAIAMHLLEKAKAGLTLPPTLPASLSPDTTKFNTVARSSPQTKKKVSVPDQQSSTVEDSAPLTFEDRRKLNFEAGRRELERRKEELRKQQEKEAAEKERKKRQEEERRLQAEREAEEARQAELERQRRKALEIEKERERQMQKLALQREAEMRELEKKRKEEWARKRLKELESQRDWEKKSLQSLRAQHSELEKELQHLDQRKFSAAASIERQRQLSTEVSTSMRTLSLSHDIRRAELTKLHSELNGYQTQLSSLQRQRRELQQALQSAHPGAAAYQRQRQQFKDSIIGLAASLAGLRSNMTYGAQAGTKAREAIHTNTKALEELKLTYKRGEVKTRELRQLVATRRHAFEQQRKRIKEEQQRKAAIKQKKAEEARKVEEEKERQRIDAEVKARQEERLRKIKQEQQEARKKVAMESIMADLAKAQPTSPTSQTPSSPSTAASTSTTSNGAPSLPTKPTSPSKPPLAAKPTSPSRSAVATKPGSPTKTATPNKPGSPAKSAAATKPGAGGVAPVPAQRKKGSGSTSKDEEVRRKVQELQRKKEELQNKQKEQQSKDLKKKPTPPPNKPGPFISRKIFRGQDKPESSKLSPPVKENTLVDLMSSWDNSAQTAPGIQSFIKDESQILQPMKSGGEAEEEEVATIESETKPEDLYSVPLKKTAAERTKPEPKKQHSVSRLSKIFEEKAAALQEESAPLSPTATSPTETKAAVGGRRSKSPLEQKPLPPIPTAEPPATSPTAFAPTSIMAIYDVPPVADSGEEEYLYQVLYDYTATDATELTIKEGDLVISVAGFTAGMSPGWLMVRQEGELDEGWVPESYVKKVGLAYSPEPPAGTAVKSPVDQKPMSPPSVKAKVLFAWQGSKDNHLPLKKGALLKVYEQKEKWWSGELEGKVGWFPKTFVKIVSDEEAAKVEEKGPSKPQETMPATGERGSDEQHIYDTAGGGGERPEEIIYEEFPEEKLEKLKAKAAAASGAGAGAAGGGGGGGGVMDGGRPPAGSLYEAIYDYEGQAEGDLTFKAGDVIEVTLKEGSWWSGKLNGVQGVFPSNYVQQKENRPPTPPTTSHPSAGQGVTVLGKPVIAKVVAAYTRTKDSQLNLSPGDLVRVRQQATNGWWEGELQSRGKQKSTGWFPANRVEVLTRQHNTSSTSSLSGNLRAARSKSPLLDILDSSKPKPSSQNLVLALYSYTAQSSDELSFHKGSVITVLSKEDGDWWRGEVNGLVGLFPSNYVQPLTGQLPTDTEPTRWADSVSPDILEAVTEKERKRQEAIFELLTSERHYVDSLKMVKELFFDPMEEQEVLTEEERSKVTVNWNELIKCSSYLLNGFLVRLRMSGAVVRCIGDVLVTQIPNLTPYIRWCGCQLTACTLLQQKSSDPKYKEFEAKCTQNRRTKGLPLSSFLLKPMQRITKYPLLIKRILDYTSEGDVDHADLQKALESAEKLCDQVNEGVRQKENTEKLEWMQTNIQLSLDERLVFNSTTNFMGSRKLLHCGKLFKIRGAKDVVVFLFNDFLLIVKPKLFLRKAATPADLEPFGKNEFIVYRHPFLLDGMRVKRAPVESYGPSAFLVMHASEDKEVPLRAETDKVRDQWMQQITKATLDYVTTKKKMDREKEEQYKRTLRESMGMLKVTVVEGSDLLAKDPNGKSDPFCVVKLAGAQEQTTPVVQASLNPKWNCEMKFAVYDLNKDSLEITVFDKDLFSPNDFLGCAKLTLKDLLKDGDSPWTKRLLLEDVASGEIELKIDLTINKKNLLLQ